jgi:hypothetical protein
MFKPGIADVRLINVESVATIRAVIVRAGQARNVLQVFNDYSGVHVYSSLVFVYYPYADL